MRQAFALVLLGGLAGMAVARGAYADQTPDAGHYDSRMRYVAYNPGQVVHLSTIVGATMVVSFAPDETVTSVAETDSLHLAAVPKGNYLFLKPSAALTLQPIIVLRRYPPRKVSGRCGVCWRAWASRTKRLPPNSARIFWPGGMPRGGG